MENCNGKKNSRGGFAGIKMDKAGMKGGSNAHLISSFRTHTYP